ncbi:hypothetical protein LXL04_033290 [Taraxacum kok-saghyz]
MWLVSKSSVTSLFPSSISFPSCSLEAKLHHGHLSNVDGNGDWVMTISTALSLVSHVLDFSFCVLLSHVAVIFDHDGL